jgi:hypothetical protein
MAVFTLAKAALLFAPSTINPALPLFSPDAPILTAVPFNDPKVSVEVDFLPAVLHLRRGQQAGEAILTSTA